MSNVYISEPIIEGRVIFETTHGPLDISLWCRECPTTTKYFLQLCIDGYYNNMYFHRIIPSLLIQTGTIRQKSTSSSVTALLMDDKYRTAIQADVALQRRKYEINTRIRFNHRGQVAMALGVNEDDDDGTIQPQFFITTEEASYLDGKHVIFGTLGNGPTIFNAIRICQNTEINENTNQPIDMENAPRIISTKIVSNPIHTTLVPIDTAPWKILDDAAASKLIKKKKKRKGKLDVNVLSFGDEMGEDVSIIPKKVKNDKETSATTTNKADDDNDDDEKNEGITKEEKEQSKKDKSLDIKATTTTATTADRSENIVSSNADNDHRKNDFIDQKRNVKDDIAANADDEKYDKKLKERKEQNQQSENNNKKQKSLVEERREKYMKGRKNNKDKKQRDDDTMAKLLEFQQKIGKVTANNNNNNKHGDNSVIADNSLAARMARRVASQKDEENDKDRNDDDVDDTYHGQILDSDNDDDNDKNWLQTKFQCKKHIDHNAGADGRDIEDYEVIIDEKDNTIKRSLSSSHHDQRNNKRRHKHRHHNHKKESKSQHRHR